MNTIRVVGLVLALPLTGLLGGCAGGSRSIANGKVSEQASAGVRAVGREMAAGELFRPGPRMVEFVSIGNGSAYAGTSTPTRERRTVGSPGPDGRWSVLIEDFHPGKSGAEGRWLEHQRVGFSRRPDGTIELVELENIDRNEVYIFEPGLLAASASLARGSVVRGESGVRVVSLKDRTKRLASGKATHETAFVGEDDQGRGVAACVLVVETGSARLVRDTRFVIDPARGIVREREKKTVTVLGVRVVGVERELELVGP